MPIGTGHSSILEANSASDVPCIECISQGKKTKVIDEIRISAIKNYIEEYILTSTPPCKTCFLEDLSNPRKLSVLRESGRSLVAPGRVLIQMQTSFPLEHMNSYTGKSLLTATSSSAVHLKLSKAFSFIFTFCLMFLYVSFFFF